MELKDLSIANLKILKTSGWEESYITINFYDTSMGNLFCGRVLYGIETKIENSITSDTVTNLLKEQMSKEAKILIDIKFMKNSSYDAVVVFYER